MQYIVVLIVLALVWLFRCCTKSSTPISKSVITEGKFIKGGINPYNPDAPRPAPPKGQGK